MAHLNKLSLIAATFVLTICSLQPASAKEPPSDLCSLLPATELSKALGQSYDSPQKSVAPRPFPNTAEGTDCMYKRSKDARERKVVFRVYVDPSPAAAADLFARLSKFFGPPTPVTVGDQAYFDKHHGLHVLKGKVRFFITMDDFTSEKQVASLASQIAGQL
ncbi:MAG TPA: hypothetical protein VIK39_19080 [Candidatus Angelobacter sp.]